MTSEWDDTPWAGSVPTLPRPVRSPDMATIEKAAVGPGVGFYDYGIPLASIRRSPQKLMREAQALYHSNPWIRVAENAVTRRVVGLPWHLEDEQDDEVEDEAGNPALKPIRDLLEKPQQFADVGRKMTRRGLWSLTSRHMGLCGIAYWYQDQMDANGTPLAHLYVNPARVWPAEDDRGNLVGWVLDAKDDQGRGGLPLRLDELVPFYLEEPDWGHLPTGLVEAAALKARITNLGDQYAAQFLGNAGRLGGFVSPKDGILNDDQYQQLVSAMRNVAENLEYKRMTILRGPLDYTETGADPGRLALPEIVKMNRDDILAVWGVPPSQAGVGGQTVGLNSGETRRYEYQILMQGPVHDRVVVMRETIQYQILDRWQKASLAPELEIEEPDFDDDAAPYELAQKAKEQPLTRNERRAILKLDPLPDYGPDGKPLGLAIDLPATLVISGQGEEPEGGSTPGRFSQAPTEQTEEPPAGDLGGLDGLPDLSALGLKADLDALDLTLDEVEEEMGLIDEPEKAGPKFIFGRLNPAYSSSASKQDISKELAAIEARARKKGFKPDRADILATYRRNLARKLREGIAERARKKFGKAPSQSAVEGTLRRLLLRNPKLRALFAGRLPAKASVRGNVSQVRDSLLRKFEPTIRKAVAALLVEQRTEVASRVRDRASHLAKKPNDRAVWWDGAKWDKRLTETLKPAVLALASGSAERVTAVLERPQKADPFEERVAQAVMDSVAKRVTGINETTRDDIAKVIGQGVTDGLTAQELADRVEASTAFDDARAELIARTESATVYNDAAIASYREFGVERVEVIDGDADDICASVAGKVYPIGEQPESIGHPNCTRDFAPYFGGA